MDLGKMNLAQLNAELAKMARAANRRIERATPGQRNAMAYYTRHYTTRQSEKYGFVFKQGAAKTMREAKQRLAELNRFMEDAKQTTTRKGWEKLKRENVERAGKTIREALDLDISDDELTVILKELGANKDKREYYTVLNNVSAAKADKGDDLTPAEVRKAMRERRSEQESVMRVLRGRKK